MTHMSPPPVGPWTAASRSGRVALPSHFIDKQQFIWERNSSNAA